MHSTSLTCRNQVFSVYRRKPLRKCGYVVVHEAEGKSFCYCWYTQTSKEKEEKRSLLPLIRHKTGIAFKPANLQKNHVIIYRKHVVPPKLPGEEGITRDSLRIVGSHAKKKFAPYARLDLSRVYRIHQYLRVRQTGEMSDEGLVKLLQYRKEIRDREQKLCKVCRNPNGHPSDSQW